MIIIPRSTRHTRRNPELALHGAGVDIITDGGYAKDRARGLNYSHASGVTTKNYEDGIQSSWGDSAALNIGNLGADVATWIFVCRPDFAFDAGSREYQLMYMTGSGNVFELGYSAWSGVRSWYYIIRGGFGATVTLQSAGSITSNRQIKKPQVIVARYDVAGEKDLFVNGALVANSATATNSMSTSVAFNLGGQSGNYWSGGLYSVIRLDRFVTDFEIQRISRNPELLYKSKNYYIYDYIGGGTTITIQTSLDSLIKKQNLLKTAAIDSLLQKQGLTKTTQINSLLSKTITNTVSLNSLLQKTLLITNSIDSLLKSEQTKTASIDSNLQKNQTLTNSIDSMLEKLITKTNSIDAILVASGTSIFTTLDSYLQKTVNVINSVDSLIQAGFIKTSTLDAILSKTYTLSASLDAILNQVKSITLSLDAYIKKQAATKNTSIDAIFTIISGIVVSADNIIGIPSDDRFVNISADDLKINVH